MEDFPHALGEKRDLRTVTYPNCKILYGNNPNYQGSPSPSEWLRTTDVFTRTLCRIRRRLESDGHSIFFRPNQFAGDSITKSQVPRTKAENAPLNVFYTRMLDLALHFYRDNELRVFADVHGKNYEWNNNRDLRSTLWFDFAKFSDHETLVRESFVDLVEMLQIIDIIRHRDPVNTAGVNVTWKENIHIGSTQRIYYDIPADMGHAHSKLNPQIHPHFYEKGYFDVHIEVPLRIHEEKTVPLQLVYLHDNATHLEVVMVPESLFKEKERSSLESYLQTKLILPTRISLKKYFTKAKSALMWEGLPLLIEDNAGYDVN